MAFCFKIAKDAQWRCYRDASLDQPSFTVGYTLPDCPNLPDRFTNNARTQNGHISIHLGLSLFFAKNLPVDPFETDFLGRSPQSDYLALVVTE